MKDLIFENIALHRVRGFHDVPIGSYVETICSTNRYAEKAGRDLDAVFKNSKNLLKQLENEIDLASIKKDYIFNSLCDIFKIYFLGKHFFEICRQGRG